MTSTQTAGADSATGPFYVDAEAAEAFGRGLLIAHDLPEEAAATVARCLVKADLRGVDTHGLQTLPHYLERVRRGLINPRPNLKVERVTPVAGALDGQDAFGFVVATKAMAEAIDMAREFGVGIVSARRSTHFGAACNYALQAMDAGFIGIVFTNASRAMPPWGGREGLLGTSPIAVAAPAGKETPFDLDMSPAVAARGKIRRAARRGQQMPLGYALDAKGRQTTDPHAALDGGTVQPIGGPKGSALAMLMDVMGGVISGAAFGGDVRNHFEDYEAPQNVGHFIMAMRPDLFVSRDEYLKRMDVLAQRVHANQTAEGFDEVIMPGERERRLEAKHRRTGLPFHAKEMAALQEAAAKAGLPQLAVSTAPLD
ncbi:Ldh family oxidoreductase [Bradyrhizobium sp.]|uniref:Ldh family oxidoreductase n=1 Tax=Bradyrhizobium sp. TaxID=376 RepID=UPI002D43C79F|nr:Ldh family oxidoreductase [Bradyrhizobium sp.]HZR74201.1 Ldh family oxidoreductase [Bradyrhizobium sp.]